MISTLNLNSTPTPARVRRRCWENTADVSQKVRACGILLQSGTAILISPVSSPRRIRMHALEKLKPLGLLLLRVALGVIFVYHGYPKLFGRTPDAMQWFAHLGLPGYFVYIAGVIEFFGGLMLIAGLFTRIAGLLLAGEMAVGLWAVHNIISNPMAVGNYELPLVLAASTFALATVGAGLISFDQALFHEGRPSSRKSKGRD
jgi:putative oxidoreductase